MLKEVKLLETFNASYEMQNSQRELAAPGRVGIAGGRSGRLHINNGSKR